MPRIVDDYTISELPGDFEKFREFVERNVQSLVTLAPISEREVLAAEASDREPQSGGECLGDGNAGPVASVDAILIPVPVMAQEVDGFIGFGGWSGVSRTSRH